MKWWRSRKYPNKIVLPHTGTTHFILCTSLLIFFEWTKFSTFHLYGVCDKQKSFIYKQQKKQQLNAEKKNKKIFIFSWKVFGLACYCKTTICCMFIYISELNNNNKYTNVDRASGFVIIHRNRIYFVFFACNNWNGYINCKLICGMKITKMMQKIIIKNKLISSIMELNWCL